MTKRVYLAGPIDGLDYSGCTDWRDYAKRELAKDGIEAFSPMRGRENLRNSGVISGTYEGPLASSKGITRRDRFDVKNCDVMLTNLRGAKKISIGTMIEYGMASAWDKLVITIMGRQGDVHEHLMLDEITGYRVETLNEGILVARAILIS